MPMEWRQRIRTMTEGWRRKGSSDKVLKGGPAAGASSQGSKPAGTGRAPDHSIDAEQLLAQVKVAHTEWVCAQKRLDYVVSEDEIDYAIFALETAEKRYGILLKQAKAMNVTARSVPTASVRLHARQSRSLGG